MTPHKPELYIRIALSLLLSLTLGCPGSGRGSKNHLLAVTESKVALSARQFCESKIRQSMQERSLSLVEVNESEIQTYITEANLLRTQTQQIRYGLLQMKENMQSVDVIHFNSTDSEYQGITYSLKLPDSTTDHLFDLEINYQSIAARRALDLEQNFSVGNDCQVKATKTILEIIEKSASSYSARRKTVYYDGAVDTDNANIPLDLDKPLYNLTPESGDGVAASLNHMQTFIFDIDIGLFEFSTHPIATEQTKAFGLELNLSGVEAVFIKDGFELIRQSILIDERNAVIRSALIPGQEVHWSLPRKTWEAQSLAGSRDGESKVQSELPKDYFVNNFSMLYVANELPSYDHFSAYWKSSGQSKDHESGLPAFDLEQADGTIKDRVVPEDLVSNDTIQTELPEIQRVAKSLHDLKRDQQIEGILKYLNDHYSYDHSMVNQDGVRPLTTEEALSRGTGVCQHYAVIYTAIARALKIPTRIVHGFHLSENAVLHA